MHRETSDEILRPIVVPFIHDHHLMLQHDNARPHVARICPQFLEDETNLVLAWPAYSLDMSIIEHVWDALDQRIRQHVPVPANIQQVHTAIEEEWTNIPQATINNLINSMRSRCVALREANGGHTRYLTGCRTPPRWRIWLRLLGLMAAGCSDNPSGAPFYASSTEVSTKVWPLSTDRFDVWDICYKRTSESPPLVERANKYHEMFSAGHVLRRQLITTDASMRGWGVMLNGTWVRGHWEPPWTSQHINVLESRAIHLALGNSLPNLADHHILVRTDNVVAAPYMNRKGGLTSLLLCKVSHNLLTWAQPHILSLKAVHLLGLQTQAADMLSRGGPWPEEWRLHPDVVKIIWDHFWDGKKNLIQKYCINKNKNTVFYLIHLKLRYLLVYFKTNCDVSLPKPANRCANGNALVKVQHKSWHNAPFTIKKEFAIE